MSAVTRSGSPRWILAVAAVVLAVAGGGSTSARDQKPEPQATCVLSNPAYSGLCTQSTPLPQGSTPAQACQSVLACLNNANCLKTYCNATTVRTGWKLESAK